MVLPHRIDWTSLTREFPLQLEDAIAEGNGCKPCLPSVPHKWPGAIDLLIRQHHILLSGHTFEQLTEYFGIPTMLLPF